MENQNIKISPLTKFGISIFFSFIFLSYAISLFFGVVDMVLTKYNNLSGTVYCYTVDSVFVDINWEVKYVSNRLSDEDIIDFDSSINYIMNKDIPKMIKNMDYLKYLEYKKDKILFKSKYTKIEIFKD
jgi:hypothetical protein